MAPAVGTALTGAVASGWWIWWVVVCDTQQRQVPAVFAELVDGASLQFIDRVVVLAVTPQRQVVDIPVMAQLQIPLDRLP